MKLGVTIAPASASATRGVRAARPGATVAMRPPLMPTSSRPSMPLAGSITRQLVSPRSSGAGSEREDESSMGGRLRWLRPASYRPVREGATRGRAPRANGLILSQPTDPTLADHVPPRHRLRPQRDGRRRLRRPPDLLPERRAAVPGQKRDRLSVPDAGPRLPAWLPPPGGRQLHAVPGRGRPLPVAQGARVPDPTAFAQSVPRSVPGVALYDARCH